MRPLLGGLFALLMLSFAGVAHADDSAKPPVTHTPAQRVVAAGFVPTWLLKATLYHGRGGGAGARDSLGCRPIAMRTVAVDPTLIPRRTILFIAETVGLPLPGGGKHDGYWYASDTGGSIKGSRIDLFTGGGAGSMKPAMTLNLKKITIAKAGKFDGCPPATR
jgi:3D (Asp-Asp-Asp) domain-containing protein